MAIKREELEKYSRAELENIIVNVTAVVDRFHIVSTGNNFSFHMDGKDYDAKTLVDTYELMCMS